MAEFYGTLAKADDYHEARGNTAWTGDEPTKKAAMLRGSEWVDHNFRSRFPGWKAGHRDQIREWPRTWAYDIEYQTIPADVVPIEAEQASYEAALRELTEPGSLSPDFVPGTQQKSVKVDVIAVEYTGPAGVSSVKPVLTIAGGILAPILTGGPGRATTVRI